MAHISDEYMRSMLTTVRPYCMVLLKSTGKAPENMQQIIWEHGRRNFALRSEGKIAIVAPVSKQADVAGLYIFNTGEAEAAEILKGDPAVQAGIFDFATYPIMSFPGDCLE